MKRYSLLANKIVFSSTLWRTEDDLHKYYVRKESNTIEDLCDEFIRKWSKKEFPDNPSMQHDRYSNYDNLKITISEEISYGNHLNRDYEIYGAIWTDKGLIYVAKMNEKGEFELL